MSRHLPRLQLVEPSDAPTRRGNSFSSFCGRLQSTTFSQMPGAGAVHPNKKKLPAPRNRPLLPVFHHVSDPARIASAALPAPHGRIHFGSGCVADGPGFMKLR
jgi:hypothetical protein